MAGRNKRKRHFKGRCLALTPEMVALVRDALTCFERPLHQANHQEENVVFAEELVQQIKRKLTLMQQSHLVGFDYNEKVVLRQALLLYTIELLPDDPKASWKLSQCHRLSGYLAEKKE